MKFRSIFASFLAALILSVSMTSCNNDNKEDDPKDKPHTEDHRVAYVLCNGKLGSNNGSLTLMYLDSNPIITIPQIYKERNGKQVGDLAQDFIYQDDYIFMLVSGSKSLVKMNPSGMEVSRYEFPETDGSPRYMVYYEGKIFVTVWGTGVVVFDADTMTRDTEIAVGKLPEKIQVWNDKIYVANQSNKYAKPTPIFDNRVSVIDPLTNTKEQDITVVENPVNLVLCDGVLYVVSKGNYEDVAPSVQRLDLNGENYSLKEVSTASTVWTDNSKLYMIQVTYAPDYSFTNDFSVYDPATEQTTKGYFFKGTPVGVEGTSFYMFHYDEKSNRYFVGTMRDYTSNGDIYVFDGDLNMLSTFDAGGMYPAKMIVVDL